MFFHGQTVFFTHNTRDVYLRRRPSIYCTVFCITKAGEEGGRTGVGVSEAFYGQSLHKRSTVMGFMGISKEAELYVYSKCYFGWKREAASFITWLYCTVLTVCRWGVSCIPSALTRLSDNQPSTVWRGGSYCSGLVFLVLQWRGKMVLIAQGKYSWFCHGGAK
jgi:hypothetical protein